MRPTVRERLTAKLVPDPQTGCLLWTGYVGSNGYGLIYANGKQQGVHRVAWELENGPIPPGLDIDHVYDRGCRHKHCANAAHLEPVTRSVNIHRADISNNGREHKPRPPLPDDWTPPPPTPAAREAMARYGAYLDQLMKGNRTTQ